MIWWTINLNEEEIIFLVLLHFFLLSSLLPFPVSPPAPASLSLDLKSPIMSTAASTLQRRYYCHKCDQTLSLSPPSSPDDDVTCPRCCHGFIEELPDNPHPIPNPNPNPNPNPSPTYNISSLNDLSFLLGPTPGQGGGVTGTQGYDPFSFIYSQLLGHVSNGTSIQIVVDPAGLDGIGGMGRPIGDYFFGSGLEQLIQQLAENDPSRYGSPPAAKSAVEALPDVTITEAHLKADSATSVQCSVCMDNFEAGIIAKQLPCKHLFHKDCILPWLELHSSCPVCRYELPTDNEARRVNETGVGTGTGTGVGTGGGQRGAGRRFRVSMPFWPFGGRGGGSGSGSGGEGSGTQDGNGTRQEDLD